MNDELKTITSCRICHSSKVFQVLKLNDTPLEDQFLRQKKFQNSYPLELYLCESCSYLFLKHIIKPKISYDNYIYESKVTMGLSKHYINYAKNIKETLKFQSGDLAIDIGSNDGSMIFALQQQALKAIGIEPAKKIAKIANAKGLETINSFFDIESAQNIKKKYGSAKIITANYVFANIDNLDDFCRCVEFLLDKSGVFIIQTGYHPEQFKVKMFDYIYHEHFSYFSLYSMNILFRNNGLKIIDVTAQPFKGGSIRVFVEKNNGIRKVKNSVKNLIEKENKQKVNLKSTYYDFSKKLIIEKNKVLKILNTIKNNGEKIVAFGASHSTTTLINHFDLREFIDYIVDDNPSKFETFSPGFHIPVYSSNKLYVSDIKFVIILAWQHQETIIKKHSKFILNGGEFFVPLPIQRLINKKNYLNEK